MDWKDMKLFDKVLFGLIAFVFILAFTFVGKAMGSDENGYRFCLAQNIYFEAGNQPFSGKLAVANVTINRTLDTQFPNNICGVVYQSKRWYTSFKTGEQVPVKGLCQFSWFCDGKPDEVLDSTTWLESIRVADLALDSGMDITDGALYYHADYIHPYWADHLERLVTIENHIFYK